MIFEFRRKGGSLREGAQVNRRAGRSGTIVSEIFTQRSLVSETQANVPKSKRVTPDHAGCDPVKHSRRGLSVCLEGTGDKNCRLGRW